jgi:hypothetical protein
MAEEETMKKLLGALLLLIAGVSAYYLTRANPIPNPSILINELAFTSDGWVMEVEFPDTGQASYGCVITSNLGTDSLKPMAVKPDTLYLITQDSLLGTSHINPSGDHLTIVWHAFPTWVGYFDFGPSSSTIEAPKPGQSICYLPGYYYYLDDTPTLGYQNDTMNATGYVAGLVKNSGVPLQGVKVTTLAGGDSTTTGADGHFVISSVARRQTLTFSAQNYIGQSITKQIWPDSTVALDVSLVVSVEKIKGQAAPKDFVISEPYPNPFNPETQVQYSLPKKSDVTINVYDMSGKLVDRVFSGSQSSGTYLARWNAVSAPSGVYVIQICTGLTALSKKCVLVK